MVSSSAAGAAQVQLVQLKCSWCRSSEPKRALQRIDDRCGWGKKNQIELHEYKEEIKLQKKIIISLKIINYYIIKQSIIFLFVLFVQEYCKKAGK